MRSANFQRCYDVTCVIAAVTHQRCVMVIRHPRYLGASGRLWSSNLESALEGFGDAMDGAAPGESLAEPSDSAAVDGSRLLSEGLTGSA